MNVIQIFNATRQLSPIETAPMRRSELDFQDSSHGSHLGFPIGTISAILDLQVTPMLPTKFQVNWLFGLGEEAKKRFSRWPPQRPSAILDFRSERF